MSIKVYCVWTQDRSDGYIELADAWDEFAVDGNHDGWLNAVQGVRDKYPDADVRIQVVRVPKVDDLFAVPEVTAEDAK